MLRSALPTPGATRVMRASDAFYIAICYSNVAHHVYNICVGCARDAAPAACNTHFCRVCRACVVHSCIADVAHF
jgi:hypothetical protein